MDHDATCLSSKLKNEGNKPESVFYSQGQGNWFFFKSLHSVSKARRCSNRELIQRKLDTAFPGLVGRIWSPDIQTSTVRLEPLVQDGHARTDTHTHFTHVSQTVNRFLGVLIRITKTNTYFDRLIP